MERLSLQRLKPKKAKEYTYYTIPKPLVDDPLFDGVSLDAALLYCQMAERLVFSEQNADDFTDSNGNIFIIYSVEEIAEKRRCSLNTAVKWLAQLENKGLIEKKRRGQGKPTLIYVNDFMSAFDETEPAPISEVGDPPEPEISESQKVKFLNRKICDSRIAKNQTLESQNLRCIKKDLREKDLKDLSSSSEEEEELSVSKLLKLEQEIKQQIQEQYLLEAHPGDSALIGSIVELMVELECRNGSVTIGGTVYPGALVKKRLHSLDFSHIEYVMAKAKSVKGVHSPKAYLLTLLYNAPTEMEFAEQVEINGFNDGS